MPTITSFPHALTDEHHAWHDPNGHPGLPTRTHRLPAKHSGEEFLFFHRDFMARARRWLAQQPFAAQFDLSPWTSVPSELRHNHLGWHQWAGDANRLGDHSDSFGSEDELGIFIEGGIHNNFLHGATAAAFGEQLVATFHSPQSTLFYKIHGLVQHWWDRWVDRRHATDRRVFSAGYYFLTYGDLRDAFGNTAGAEAHWLRHGFFERRRSATHFDVDFYLSQHGDLVDAFGTDGAARAISHWIHHGIGEGRRSSLIFDVRWYLANHPDLTAAFGADNFPAALEHWLDHGLGEARRAAPDFDVGFYLGAHPDLVAAFGADGFEAAAAHWMEFGRAEGRQAVP